MNAKRTLVVAVAAASLTVGAVAQVPAPDGAAVPREQYEQLKNNYDALDARLKALEARERGAATTAPTTGPASTQPASAEEVQDLQRKVETIEEDLRKRSDGGVQLNPRPGWEKPAGWMTPSSRAEDMDLKVGSFDNIDLYLGLQTAGRFQMLNHEDAFVGNNELDSLDPSFQTAWGDLPFLADIGKGKMLVFFDLYISSRPHPSTMYGNEGYILIRELPDPLPGNGFLNNTIFKYVNVKAGHFEIDYGDSHYRRSDNAWVQRNLLIGNYLVDPDVEEIGLEVFSKPGPVNWLVGATSGTTTENYSEGRGIASVHGKLWGDVVKDLRAAVSGYYVDHSDNPTSGPGSTKGSLYSGRRSGGPYGGVFGGGNSPGEVFIGKDELVTAFQGDLTWTPGPWEVYTNVGWVQDADPNGSDPGSPEERWVYGAVEGAYHFTPRIYAAARYSYAVADQVAGQPSGGSVHRVQVGGGYWILKHLLTKAELVYETLAGFDENDGSVAGVRAADDPYFYGAIFEVSFAF